MGYEEWFIQKGEEGLAQVERGEVLDHEQIVAKIENPVREKQPRA